MAFRKPLKRALHKGCGVMAVQTEGIGGKENKPSDLSETDEAAVLHYLDRIGETEPAKIQHTLDRCVANPKVLNWILNGGPEIQL